MTGQTEEPAERQDAPDPDKKPALTAFDADTVNYVENHIPSMSIGTAIFGIDNQHAVRRVQATGPVTDSTITEATTGYEPPDCHEDAKSRLAKEHAIVLVGSAGIGKRTAALVLLRAVTDGKLVLLSPLVSLSDLANRKFDQGAGYAVIDHIAEHTTGESEHSWRVVRERLAAAGSYLVVTTTTEPSVATEVVHHVRWARPNLEHVLQARMSVPLSDDDRAAVADVLAGATRIRDVVELARRLDAGEPLANAADHFEQTTRNAVCHWFDQNPSRRQIMEVTTLAFALGASDRSFESMLAAFERALARCMPEPDTSEQAPTETSLPQRRHRLTGPGSLIIRRTVSSDLGPRSELVFASPGYHRHVLGLLWERMEVAFWDAVRSWLDEMVTVDDPRVAFGLARLAEYAFDEVLALLEPWSAGSRGVGGQWVSILVLSTMALDDELSPAALQTATRWINSRDTAKRWAAAVSIGAELGVRYPHVASNRLWQLCTQAHTTTGDASVALAKLFVTLARKTPDAGIVLTMLADKLGRFGRPGGNLAMHAVAISATLAVLGAHDPVSNRRSFLLYLEQFPERVDTITQLWAAVLRNRPTRLRAITALQGALKDIAEHDERPAHQVRQLGAALAEAMTETDRDQLQLDMRRVADRNGIGNDALAALLSALLKALGRTEPPNKES